MRYKPCAKGGCGKLVPLGTGRCEVHRNDWLPPSGIKKTTKEAGYTGKWVRIRKRVMERDRWLCQECLRTSRLEPATQVDHITPKAEGGTDDMDNLQALCKSCHMTKTANEVNARRYS